MTTERAAGKRTPGADTFERIYRWGVWLKGIDGTIELIVGLLLCLVPSTVRAVLAAVIGEADEGSSALSGAVAGYVGNLYREVANGGSVFLIVFLIVHGVVKLVLVYCLIRRLRRLYPAALAILVALLGYQVFTLARAPSIGLVLLSILDVAIIYLVWREYRILQREASAPANLRD